MKNLNEYIIALRTGRNMSQVEVANEFQHRGYEKVTNQIVYSWESGRVRIPSELLLVLCDILHIADIRAAFDMNEMPSLLSGLNDTGCRMVWDYADLLRASGLYSKEPLSSTNNSANPRRMRLFHLPVSAGTGQFLDDDAYDEIEVGNEVPENADFGVTISGDSMEPQFINGQTVWVHAQSSLQDGEIGIFYHNGEGFIKKLDHQNDRPLLISLNKKYKPREIHEDDEFLVFGKVVG
ncbi:MAG: LexA family transcriptional regulator [Lachnospiraceae bacterium]|nr:LexA family transcriptional regulator [Lachnospiraceae bacterium]